MIIKGAGDKAFCAGGDVLGKNRSVFVHIRWDVCSFEFASVFVGTGLFVLIFMFNLLVWSGSIV